MSNDPLRARFERCDRDGDGQIDEREFGLMLNGLGVGYSDAQIHAAFESIDTNKSGHIDFDEFCAWWQHR